MSVLGYGEHARPRAALPDASPAVTRAIDALRTASDPGIVYMDNRHDLARLLANRTVSVVRMRSGVTYWLRSDVAITRAVEFQMAPGASIRPYSETGTLPQLVVSAGTSLVTFRDVTSTCPIRVESPVDFFNVRVGGLVGRSGILINAVDGPGSGFFACR